jgi:hypothetical protein
MVIWWAGRFIDFSVSGRAGGRAGGIEGQASYFFTLNRLIFCRPAACKFDRINKNN